MSYLAELKAQAARAAAPPRATAKPQVPLDAQIKALTATLRPPCCIVPGRWRSWCLGSKVDSGLGPRRVPSRRRSAAWAGSNGAAGGKRG